jgi:hypothetical protein
MYAHDVFFVENNPLVKAGAWRVSRDNVTLKHAVVLAVERDRHAVLRGSLEVEPGRLGCDKNVEENETRDLIHAIREGHTRMRNVKNCSWFSAHTSAHLYMLHTDASDALYQTSVALDARIISQPWSATW